MNGMAEEGAKKGKTHARSGSSGKKWNKEKISGLQEAEREVGIRKDWKMIKCMSRDMLKRV